MDIGEPVSIAMPEPERPSDPKEEDNKKHVKIRFCIFFDGTCNNRVNTLGRLGQSEAYLEDKGKKDQAKSASYENDFTNVNKMELHVDIAGAPPPGYDFLLATYIEGPGTTNNGSDSTLGYGIGMGATGVREKVKKGVLDVVNKIGEKLPDKAENIIDRLTLDVFGFSRGAAAARNFIHEALFGSAALRTQLEAQGYTLAPTGPDTGVDVCFAGLFDTVSSYGLGFIFGDGNNTKSLKLHAVKHAKTVLHLVAAEEHRENFSLTDITSAGKKGREIYLPGVHSDVGGSYCNAKPEEHAIYAGRDAQRAAEDRAQLLAAGWFREREITLNEFGSIEEDFVTLRVNRATISNGYSRIPLHIMARFARDNGIVFRNDLDRAEEIPPELCAINGVDGVKEKIDAYIANTPQSKAEDWHHSEAWLRSLRHNHLHFSAKHEFGLKPRYIKGKRCRLIYDG